MASEAIGTGYKYHRIRLGKSEQVEHKVLVLEPLRTHNLKRVDRSHMNRADLSAGDPTGLRVSCSHNLYPRAHRNRKR